MFLCHYIRRHRYIHGTRLQFFELLLRLIIAVWLSKLEINSKLKKNIASILEAIFFTVFLEFEENNY